MTPELSDDYIRACMCAKRTMQFLPDPPLGLRKRHVYIIKVCYDLSLELEEVRVSDVAERIHVTLPSITRNITTLEEQGYLEKEENSKDKRVVNLLLTEKGMALYKNDVLGFHNENSERLKDISKEDMQITIKTIHKIYHLMEKEYMGS